LITEGKIEADVFTQKGFEEKQKLLMGWYQVS